MTELGLPKSSCLHFAASTNSMLEDGFPFGEWGGGCVTDFLEFVGLVLISL